jgi:hypothetical protein
MRWYAPPQASQDGIPFRSRRINSFTKFVYWSIGASGHLRRFLYWEFDRLAGRYFSFCGRQGLPYGRSVIVERKCNHRESVW